MTDSELLNLAGKLVAQFKEKHLRLVTVESCTGGLLSTLLTEVAGSSDVVEGGFVTYSNALKSQAVNVDPGTIAKHGAVSRDVAKEMSQGALNVARQADVSVAITGVAGPGGGTEEKPVGLVCFGLADRSDTERETRVQINRFEGDRKKVRRQAAYFAMEMLLKWAESRPSFES